VLEVLARGRRVNRIPSSGGVSDIAVHEPSELVELERIALRRQFEGLEPLRNPEQEVAVRPSGPALN